MRTTSLLTAVLGALFLNSVHAVPTKQVQSARLSCDWDNKGSALQLYAGDYNYGFSYPAVALGYKSFTENGNEIIRVVKLDPQDTTISPLNKVIRVSCNSTALNYYGHQGTFGSNIPVKLRSGIGRDGIPYCVGIQDPAKDPTEIVLVPCSEYDDDSQANQFWMSQFKYNNLYPLIGRSNTSDNVERNNSWPLLQPADGENPQVYRAGHDKERTWRSLFLK